MNLDNQGLDFSTVIASTVHDLKNSLSALIQSHSQWVQRLPEELRGGAEQGVMEHEFRHLNGMLVQLLGLYKLGDVVRLNVLRHPQNTLLEPSHSGPTVCHTNTSSTRSKAPSPP